MAQTVLSTPGVSTHHTTNLRRDSLLKLQIQNIKPKITTSHLLFSPLPSSTTPSLTSSSIVKIVALFKSKAKAAPKKVEKEKIKVEDGIFGTSGGIGFTKENELFVGRVAMLGFAGYFKDQAKEEVLKLIMKLFAPQIVASLIPLYLLFTNYTPPSYASIDVPRAVSLFGRACIGCHDAGGNLIQPGATLFSEDLQRNGVNSEEELYKITYYGKGRMPGFGEKCTPRGQCTFGPRLSEDEIRLLAQFVKLQAEQGWPNIDINAD